MCKGLLSFNDKNFISTFFNDGGYVLNFSNSEFDDFTLNSVGIPLQTQYKLSKGKSFVEFINQADDGEIIKLVTDLIEYIEYQNIEDLLTVEKRNLYPKLKALMSKFSTNQTFSSTLVTDVKEKFNDVYIAVTVK